MTAVQHLVGELEQAGVPNDVAQEALTILQRYPEQPLAVAVHDVKDHVLHQPRFLPSVLEKLKRRAALLVQHHNLAVEHSLPRVHRSTDRLQLRVLVVDNPAGAGLERDFAAVDKTD